MPEETNPQTPQTPQPPQAPTFDVDALAGQVADKLKDAFKTQQPQPQPQARPVAPPQPVAADPMGDLLKPYIDPVRAEARIAVESAEDAAEFYSNHPELEKDERLEVEKRFKTLRANGVPFKREDILAHYIGENIDKQVEKRLKKRDEAVTRAANAATVGSGSPDRGPAVVADARAMSLDQLEKALGNTSF